MLRAVIVFSVLLSLAACDSRINPLNWFGSAQEERITINPDAAGGAEDPDGRILAAEITQLSVEQTTAGAIVRATGVTPATGYFNADLVLVEETPSSLTYEFRVSPPLPGQGTAGLQTISVGTELSVGELAGIRSITVVTQSNRRTVGRR